MKRAGTVLVLPTVCVMVLISGAVYYNRGVATDKEKTSDGATPNLVPSAVSGFNITRLRWPKVWRYAHQGAG